MLRTTIGDASLAKTEPLGYGSRGIRLALVCTRLYLSREIVIRTRPSDPRGVWVVVWMDSSHDLDRATRERPPSAPGEVSTREPYLSPSVKERWLPDGLSPTMAQPRAFALGRNHAHAYAQRFC